MNRNAARHLALVVSVLLCFFVYMGYRFWGANTGDSETAPVTDTSAGTGGLAGLPQSLTPPGTPSTGTGAGNSVSSSSLRPPKSTDVSLPLGGETGGMSPTPPGGLSSAPAPIGSLEESGAGSITGLIPAPPSDSSSSAATGAGLGGIAPPGLDEADDYSVSGTGSGLALAPPPGGATASSASARSSGSPASLAPPPAGISSPATQNPASASSTGARTSGQPPSRQTGTPPLAPSESGRSSSASASGATGARPTAGSSPARQPGDSRPGQGNVPPGRTQIAEPVPPRTPMQPVEPETSDSLRIYVIQPGDTLSRIATRELGSISLADNIYLLNRDVISDPDHLLVGMRIRLPVRERLGTGQPATNGNLPPAGPGRGTVPVGTAGRSPEGRVHRVQRGETLSSISLRYYGTSAGWRNIYEANRDVLPNPNQLQVGMELVVPPFGG